MADSRITAAFHVSGAESNRLIRFQQLLRPFARRPLRAKVRQDTPDLVAAHPIAALVGPAAGGVLDVASRNGFLDYVGELADTVVLFGMSNVERLVMDGLLGRLQNANNGGDNVANVDDGTPRSAVAFDVH